MFQSIKLQPIFVSYRIRVIRCYRDTSVGVISLSEIDRWINKWINILRYSN